MVRNYFTRYEAIRTQMMLLNHFMPMFSFYPPWKHQKIRDFLMLLGGLERDQWHEMGQRRKLFPWRTSTLGLILSTGLDGRQEKNFAKLTWSILNTNLHSTSSSLQRRMIKGVMGKALLKIQFKGKPSLILKRKIWVQQTSWNS